MNLGLGNIAQAINPTKPWLFCCALTGRIQHQQLCPRRCTWRCIEWLRVQSWNLDVVLIFFVIFMYMIYIIYIIYRYFVQICSLCTVHILFFCFRKWTNPGDVQLKLSKPFGTSLSFPSPGEDWGMVKLQFEWWNLKQGEQGELLRIWSWWIN